MFSAFFKILALESYIFYNLQPFLRTLLSKVCMTVLFFYAIHSMSFHKCLMIVIQNCSIVQRESSFTTGKITTASPVCLPSQGIHSGLILFNILHVFLYPECHVFGINNRQHFQRMLLLSNMRISSLQIYSWLTTSLFLD